jgi:hypothetical protein
VVLERQSLDACSLCYPPAGYGLCHAFKPFLSFLPLNLLIEFNMPEGTVLASYLIRPHSPAFTESIKEKR